MLLLRHDRGATSPTTPRASSVTVVAVHGASGRAPSHPAPPTATTPPTDSFSNPCERRMNDRTWTGLGDESVRMPPVDDALISWTGSLLTISPTDDTL